MSRLMERLICIQKMMQDVWEVDTEKRLLCTVRTKLRINLIEQINFKSKLVQNLNLDSIFLLKEIFLKMLLLIDYVNFFAFNLYLLLKSSVTLVEQISNVKQ